MADKLTTAAPRIAKLLRIVLSPDVSDNEWQNAYTRLMAALQEADPGGHEITRRIEAPPISEEMIKEKIKDEAKRIFEAGRAKGRAEEIESRQRGVAAIASLANINAGDGVNGCSWREIVGFCLANRHRIHSDWEANFIESVAGQLASPYSSLTVKQTPIVARIFRSWFGGRM
jgi:hypothetical protein